MPTIEGIGRGTGFSRHIDHRRRRLRRRGGLAVVRRRFTHRLPRAGPLAQARRLFDFLRRLGVPRCQQLQLRSQRACAAGRLSGRRQRVGRHAVGVRRGGRQHHPLDGACSPFSPLRLPGACARTASPTTGLFRHTSTWSPTTISTTSGWAARGIAGESRQSAARAAAHAIPSARAGRRAAGARLRQTSAGTGGRRTPTSIRCPTAGGRALQQLRPQWSRLHRAGQRHRPM